MDGALYTIGEGDTFLGVDDLMATAEMPGYTVELTADGECTVLGGDVKRPRLPVVTSVVCTLPALGLAELGPSADTIRSFFSGRSWGTFAVREICLLSTGGAPLHVR